MTREEFKNIVKAIRAAYTNTPIDSQAVFDLWYEMLKDASYEDVSRTLENHIKANKFAPTIAELRAVQSTEIDLTISCQGDTISTSWRLLYWRLTTKRLKKRGI